MGLLQRKNRLGFWRKVRGYTQQEVASWMGVTQPTISNWELDITSPTPEQAAAMAKMLRVRVRELFPHDIF